MTEADARAWVAEHVSRETLHRLEIYAAELARWQKTINLVAPSTLDHVWQRHFFDSLQLLPLVPEPARTWIDFGSGGGFPGLACAMALVEAQPKVSVTLVEADIRKCAFLRETARKTGTPIHILSRRIEDIPQQSADIITARALTSLESLCALAHPHLSDTGICLFLKGKNHQAEIDAADQNWQMKRDVIASKTDSDAVILRIGELDRA